MLQNQPLAVELRPKTIDDVVGQHHLLDDGKIIRRMVDSGIVTSMILYGVPGIGKTSIASAIAGSINLPFFMFNASTDSKKELQEAVKTADADPSGKAVLLLDEIHRLDKPKQDFLLPYMESGKLIVIGATTENPYININPAIRSRAQIFELKPVSENDMALELTKALNYVILNSDIETIDIDVDAEKLLLNSSNGDVRSMLNTLQIAIFSNKNLKDVKIKLADVEEISQRKAMRSDKNGDGHYDVISALQKSIRGSDTDAALHYAARIIESGDLQILVRRLTIIAYEDIGTAAPETVQQAVTAINTAMSIGLPEARIPIANAIVLLANAPKSNAAYNAINSALEDVINNNYTDIPEHLKDTHYKGAAKLGRGVGYKYAHDYPYDWVAQQYLPDNLYQNDPVYFKSKHTSPVEDSIEKTYLKLKSQQKQQ